MANHQYLGVIRLSSFIERLSHETARTGAASLLILYNVSRPYLVIDGRLCLKYGIIHRAPE